MKKIRMPWQTPLSPSRASEVRAGFPVAEIPVLNDVLAVYRPEQMSTLRRTRSLRLWNERFRRVPPVVWSLKELEVLELVGNCDLEEISPALGGLPRLRTLVLRGCTSLRTLPDAVRGLASLETLDLSHCRSLERLPENLLHDLPRLRRLDLLGCTSLRAAPHGRDADLDLLVLLPENLMARARTRSRVQSIGNSLGTALQGLHGVIARGGRANAGLSWRAT